MILFNKFPGGKKRAVTMSYDDGYVEDLRLIEIFNKYGVKGTFHLNSQLMERANRISAPDVANAYKGHEIAVHGAYHQTLYHLPKHGVISEILQDRANLEKLSGYIVRGMSYANGINPPEIAQIASDCGIEYSRTTFSTNGFKLPENFMLWNPTCHHKASEALAKTFANIKYDSGQLFYIWGHSCEFESDNNWSLIENTCDILSSCEEIWFATNIEIYDYITASRRMRVSVDNKIIQNPTNLDIWFTHDDETLCIKAGDTINL